jgi:hypothetical protein
MNDEIGYNGIIGFEGSKEDFEKMVKELGRLRKSGLMIGSWPTPEIVLMRLGIGTWPTPERPARIIKPRPIPGGWPIQNYVNKDILDKIIETAPRVKLDGIDGGMRPAHFHLKDEAVLLNREQFKELVTHTAMELAGKLAESADYYETINAVKNLVPPEVV